MDVTIRHAYLPDNIKSSVDSVEIAASASVSGWIDVRHHPLLHLYLPTMPSGVGKIQTSPNGEDTSPTAFTAQKTDGSGDFALVSGIGNLSISVHDVIGGAGWVRLVWSTKTAADGATIKYSRKG